MPRVKRVEKARKAQGTCSKCGCALNVGEPYIKWAFRFGPRVVRCVKPECYPKPWELTRSEFLSTLYQLQERTFDAETIEDLEAQRDEVVGELEQLRDEQEEKRSNMPDHLQDSSDAGNTLQERYDALDSAVSDLESVDISWDEPEKEEDESKKDFEERKEQELKDRLEEIANELSEVLGGISC